MYQSHEFYLRRAIEISKEAQLTADYQLVVMHIGNEEAAKTVQTELQEIYPCLLYTSQFIQKVAKKNYKFVDVT